MKLIEEYPVQDVANALMSRKASSVELGHKDFEQLLELSASGLYAAMEILAMRIVPPKEQ